MNFSNFFDIFSLHFSTPLSRNFSAMAITLSTQIKHALIYSTIMAKAAVSGMTESREDVTTKLKYPTQTTLGTPGGIGPGCAVM